MESPLAKPVLPPKHSSPASRCSPTHVRDASLVGLLIPVQDHVILGAVTVPRLERLRDVLKAAVSTLEHVDHLRIASEF